MKNRIRLLIIGKNSFIASYIFFNLKNKIFIKRITYSKFIKKSESFISKFNYLLNCSLKKEYVFKNYNKRFDIDYYILNKIKKININYIFLSSRKIYKPKLNIRETDKILPQDNYAKNKLITENYIKKNMRNNYLILRVSNIIGSRLVNNNKSHNLFLDNFIINLKNRVVFVHNNSFKDFISINQFTSIFFKIINKNLKGTFNVSLGKKIYISEILQWLTSYCKKSLIEKNYDINNKVYNSDSFTLDNSKLKKALNIYIKKKDLKKYCENLSKKIFLKIN
jgi:dTDP-4-dehydrorhamnose reductase